MDLSNVNLSGIRLTGARLANALLVDAVLNEADLDAAELTNADLRNASLIRTSERDADLSRTTLINTNLGGVRGYNANFTYAKFAAAKLGNADLSESNLKHTVISGVDASHATFAGADLTGAWLTQIGEAARRRRDQSGWYHVVERPCRFHSVDLENADLTDTTLNGVELHASQLRGANFTNATFTQNNLTDVDLSVARGLESVHHKGPSEIGLATLFRSRDVPASFLLGCGVPSILVDYLPSLIGALEPIQFHSCFISYSSNDEEFCKRLHARMRSQRVRVWYAPENVKGGEKLHDQICRAIRAHGKLVLVLSESSMHSEWVNTEIYHARQREISEGRRVLFPIRLVSFDKLHSWCAFDADSGRDMAREIREYYIPDFSDWNNSASFDNAFERLINDLRQSEQGNTGHGGMNLLQ